MYLTGQLSNFRGKLISKWHPALKEQFWISTLPETNIARENQWLEIGKGHFIFMGYVSFRKGRACWFIHQFFKTAITSCGLRWSFKSSDSLANRPNIQLSNGFPMIYLLKQRSKPTFSLSFGAACWEIATWVHTLPTLLVGNTKFLTAWPEEHRINLSRNSCSPLLQKSIYPVESRRTDSHLKTSCPISQHMTWRPHRLNLRFHRHFKWLLHSRD